jgi:hypothetical protein
MGGVCGSWLFGCGRLGPPEGWTWRVREVATSATLVMIHPARCASRVSEIILICGLLSTSKLHLMDRRK